jgi:hypothetical protein
MADDDEQRPAPVDDQSAAATEVTVQWQAIAQLVDRIQAALEQSYEMPDPDHEIWQVLRTGLASADVDPEDFPAEFAQLRRLVARTGLWVRRAPTGLGFEPVPLAEWEQLHAEWQARESKRCSQCSRTVLNWYDTWSRDGSARPVCVNCSLGDLRGDR